MHEAIIAKLDRVEEIIGAKTIQIGHVLGETVVIGKDTSVGTVGVYFPADLQLSEEYCAYNNLYRDSTKNKDITKKGFFDGNRKVRAQKFMRVRSDGYFAPLSSLECLAGKDYNDRFATGDKLTHIDGKELCRKYINPAIARTAAGIEKVKRAKVEAPYFHEHVDTEQFKYYIDKIPIGALLSFHAKQHGTSARYSCALVKRPIFPLTTLIEKLSPVVNKPITKLLKPQIVKLLNSLTRFSNRYTKAAYEHVAGTRRVLLQSEHRNKVGYNGPEGWRFEWLDRLKDHLTPGVTVYGEIVGWANGSPINGDEERIFLNDHGMNIRIGKTACIATEEDWPKLEYSIHWRGVI